MVDSEYILTFAESEKLKGIAGEEVEYVREILAVTD